jgi:hypothetical protein
MNRCHVCGLALDGLNVEYHYSRNHDLGGEHIPWGVLLLSLRETDRELGEARAEIARIRLARRGTIGAQSNPEASDASATSGDVS